MRRALTRVLVVDDYKPWLRFIRRALLAHDKLQVIGEASDGLEAVEKAHQLQPDLILLDVGLPELNGIEAARRIREVSPTSKILFVSGNRAWDIAEEGLRVGAGGYVVKSDAGRELLPAQEENCCLLWRPFSRVKCFSASAWLVMTPAHP